jgi:tryptophan halogenase
MPLPETLAYKEEQFARTGRIILGTDELFKESSWFAVLMGQGHEPKDYNPLIDAIKSADNTAYLRKLKEGIQAICAKMRPHESFLSAAKSA